MCGIGRMGLQLTFRAYPGYGKAAIRTNNDPTVLVHVDRVVQTPLEAHMNGLKLRRVVGRF